VSCHIFRFAFPFPGLLDALQNNNALLDQIQKCLEAYLESKRVVFPRYKRQVTLSFVISVEKASVLRRCWLCYGGGGREASGG